MTSKQTKELWELRGRMKKLKEQYRVVNARNAMSHIELDSQSGRIKASTMFGSFYLTEQNGELITGLSAVISLMSNVTCYEVNDDRTELKIGFEFSAKEEDKFVFLFSADKLTKRWAEQELQAA